MSQTAALSQKNLSGDIWGGFAAMLVALPSAIAFGVTIFSPLGADFGAKGALAGMLGVTALGLIAATFGGTQRLISAPCAPAAAVLSALTIQMTQQGSGVGAVVLTLFLVALMSSLVQIAFGFLRIGELIKYMPFPVVSGYLSGVGLIIVMSQLPKWMALPKGMNWWQGLHAMELWQPASLVVGAATAAFMVWAPHFTKRVPAVIVGLLGGMATYWVLALTSFPELRNLHDNPFIIGPLAVGGEGFFESLLDPWRSLNESGMPPWTHIAFPALTLAVLLSIDTLKTCVVLDAMTGSRHDSNKELIGQGLGNLASSLIGGAPGAGTMGATLVNKASGGTTYLSGVFQGVWSLLAILLLTSLIAWVPVSALAALLIVIGFRMIDWHSLQLLRSKDTMLDFAVILTVVVVANTVSLIAASGVGVALAIMLFLREQIHTSTIRRKSYGDKTFSSRVRGQRERDVLTETGSHTVIFELQGSLFFGTTDQLYTAIEPELSQAKFVVLDFLRVQSMDMTAGHMIERIRNMLAERHAKLVLTRVPERLPSGRDLRSYVDHIGLLSDSTAKIFDEFDEALEWIEDETLTLAGHAHVSHEGIPLGKFELFHGLNAQEIAALESCAKHHVYQAGDLVFGADSAGHELMLISRGEVKVSLPLANGKTIHLTTFSRGQFFGEMSFLDGRAHSADVYATRETELIAIDRKAFAAVAAGDPVMSISVMRSVALAIADRLRHANAELREMRQA
ncbi:MAG: cyclic nucleotide-binding domain-containing protein [Limnohabitans sp.]|nr:cyclic nucleotide-binding domain-containing protein [Limnohabitans sp.]